MWKLCILFHNHSLILLRLHLFNAFEEKDRYKISTCQGYMKIQHQRTCSSFSFYVGKLLSFSLPKYLACGVLSSWRRKMGERSTRMC